MGIEYLGLSSINGPLVILEGVQDAFFDRGIYGRWKDKENWKDH